MPSDSTAALSPRAAALLGFPDAAPPAGEADTAALGVPGDELLAVSVDTLIEAVHFPAGMAPADLGHRTLAVNLSDLAAMGARPLCAAMSLRARAPAEAWLERFGAGMTALARAHGMRLAGLHLGSGPLTISVQVCGRVPAAAALRRDGARPGDLIFVTGTLGDAGLALAALAGEVRPGAQAREAALQRLARPTPRIAAGLALRGVATAAIDVSDGLAADLGHVLHASGTGATLWLAELPLSAALRAALAGEAAWRMALCAGDDYELCFTVPPAHASRLEALQQRADCPLTRIGVVEARPGLRCLRPDGSELAAGAGYRHFV